MITQIAIATKLYGFGIVKSASILILSEMKLVMIMSGNFIKREIKNENNKKKNKIENTKLKITNLPNNLQVSNSPSDIESFGISFSKRFFAYFLI